MNRSIHPGGERRKPSGTARPVDVAGAAALRALRDLDLRVTAARVSVLAALQGAATPLTHREVQTALAAQGSAPVDRVTLYRVLDWLVEVSLASKAADGKGVFRFASRTAPGTHAQHVHFRCTACGGVFCLKEAPPQRPRLPRGFRLDSVSVDIQGQCARCVPH